jgi:mRNA interferase MazF
MTYPRRGEIYWVNLDPVVGSEMAKTRPALIISNNVGNEFSSRVIVAPLTTGGIEKVYPFEVLVPVGDGGVSRVSKVVLDQIRAVAKARLGGYVGSLAPARLEEVDRAIRISLSV